MRPIRFALIVVWMSFTALILSAQQQHFLSFNNFHSSNDGRIEYTIRAEITNLSLKPPKPPIIMIPTPHPEDPPPFPDPDLPLEPELIYTTVRIPTDLYTDNYYWYSPRNIFSRRKINGGLTEAMNKGVTQAKLNEAVANYGKPIDWAQAEFYESSVYMNDATNNPLRIDDKARIYGSVALNVTIPDHPGNRWVLKIVSALPEEKFLPLTLTPGSHRISVSPVEAGNALVSLFAVDANGDLNSYFQEVVVQVVRNNQIVVEGKGVTFTGPFSVNVDFAESNQHNRYRLGYLGVGHSSQSSFSPNQAWGILPLQQDREAMIRVMAYDAWGNGGNYGPNHRIHVAWQSSGGSGSKWYTSKISGRHADSGLLFFWGDIDGQNNEKQGIGPKIPAAHVRPGLTITAKLYDVANQVVPLDTKTITVQVVQPRNITLLGWDIVDVRDQVTYAMDEDFVRRNILSYIDDVFPYSKVEFKYAGRASHHKVNHVLWSSTCNITKVECGLKIVHNLLLGSHSTKVNSAKETLHVAFVTKSSVYNVSGVARNGERALSVAVGGLMANGWGPESISETTAHEMGHCYKLKHPPSGGYLYWNNQSQMYKKYAVADKQDSCYPYGGGGVTAGWGYSNYTVGDRHVHEFRAEDSHRPGPNVTPHYDIMAYAPLFTYKFSDYHTYRLSPPNSAGFHPVTADILPSDGGTGFGHIVGAELYPGTQTWIYGPQAARAAEAAWDLENGFDPPVPPPPPMGDEPPGPGNEVILSDIVTNSNGGPNSQMDDTLLELALAELEVIIQEIQTNGGILPDVIVLEHPELKGLVLDVCQGSIRQGLQL